MNKDKKANPIAGTAKVLHDAEGCYMGAVTEYDNGTFLGYFAVEPFAYGEFKYSRSAAEAFVEHLAKEVADADISMSTWQENR